MTTAVGSSTASTAANGTPISGAIAGGKMGKDEFIKLMVAQMQHQDPLNPQDGTQMATQLAQFSSVEQLMNINATLEAQAQGNSTLAAAVNNSTAIGILGKNITVQSDQIAVGSDPTGAVQTEITGAGGRLKVKIVGPTGTTLRSQELGTVSAGTHTVSLDELTSGLAAGTYTVAFELTGASGGVTRPATLQTIHADGIRYGTNGAVVTSGSRTFSIGSVVSVNASH